MCEKEVKQFSSIYFENIITFRQPSFVKMETY